jgi:transcriptional regulator with XRE-family HTH domain
MLSPGEIKTIREALGMSQVKFASLLGVHPLTVSRWERGEVTPDGATARLLEALEQGLQKKKPEPDMVRQILKAVATGAAIAGLILLLSSIFGEKGGGSK